jgi:phage terminase Nu1 subunit (DNA packaging protein)
VHFGGVILGVEKQVKMIGDVLCISASCASDLYGVHRNTLAQWVKLGMPKAGSGWYPLKASFDWVMDYRLGGEDDPEGEEPKTDAARKLRYEAKLKEKQAEAAELKNAIAKGEYIKREEVISELQRFFTTLKRSMIGYSRRVAMEVAPFVDPETVRVIEQNITDTTNAVLQQMSVRGVYHAKKTRK